MYTQKLLYETLLSVGDTSQDSSTDYMNPRNTSQEVAEKVV